MIRVKEGDILEFDKDECLTAQELAECLAEYNEQSLTKDFLDWCIKLLDDSFRVEEVRYNILFPEGTEKNIHLKNKVFYDEKYRELNIPSPFPNVWVTMPIENMKKVDVS